MKSCSRSSSRSGFTFVEALLAIVLLAIVATAVFMRITGRAYRELQVATDRVADFLLMYSHRQAMSSNPLAIAFDEQEGVLELWQLNYVEGEDRRTRVEWRLDHTVRPAQLPPLVELAEVRVDGRVLTEYGWPILTTPGHDRFSLEFILTTEGRDRHLILYPHSLSPIIVEDQFDHRLLERKPIDLNATGRGREVW